MEKYLLNQIELTKDNKALFFENYALNNALELLNEKGEESLKEQVLWCINDYLMSPAQKLFFIELNNKF
jgi:hypothetical protein